MIETLDDIVAELAPRFHINDVRDLWEAEMLKRIRAAVAIETTLAIGAAVLKGLETNPLGDKTPKRKDGQKDGRVSGRAAGGHARANSMTPAERTAVARKGALARWGKRHAD